MLPSSLHTTRLLGLDPLPKHADKELAAIGECSLPPSSIRESGVWEAGGSGLSIRYASSSSRLMCLRFFLAQAINSLFFFL